MRSIVLVATSSGRNARSIADCKMKAIGGVSKRVLPHSEGKAPIATLSEPSKRMSRQYCHMHEVVSATLVSEARPVVVRSLKDCWHPSIRPFVIISFGKVLQGAEETF